MSAQLREAREAGAPAAIFEGLSLQLLPLGRGLAELRFERLDGPVNKLDDRTIAELGHATQLLAAMPGLCGLLVTSGKDVFIVGADINEFGALFQLSEVAIADDVRSRNGVLNGLEDLPVPIVVAVNGMALGGGLEVTLAGSARVMADTAQVGVPEVKLGLFPGLGGTVRLSRLSPQCGPLAVASLIAEGAPIDAAAALALGIADAVVPSAQLREHAIETLQCCVRGEMDWRAAYRRKQQAVPDAVAAATIFNEQSAHWSLLHTVHRPAVSAALEMMARAAPLNRDDALAQETATFASVAKGQAAQGMSQVFLSGLAVRKRARQLAAGAPRGAGDDAGDAGEGNVAGVLPLDHAGLDAQRLPLPEAASDARAYLAGLHIWPSRPLAEVVQGRLTAPAAIAAAAAQALALHKTPILVKAKPGLLVQRVFMPMFHALQQCLANGDELADIDQAMVALGWRSGVSELAHERGLLIEPRDSAAASSSGVHRPFDAVRTCNALMMPLVLEAIRALEEGVAASAAEIDMALILGLGYPLHLGGPLKQADWLGAGALLASCGPGEAPALLREMAATGRKFHSP